MYGKIARFNTAYAIAFCFVIAVRDTQSGLDLCGVLSDNRPFT
jgi:hypothetical protein